MSKEKAKQGIIFNAELEGMDKIQEQLKDLNGQLDGIINKFEKISDLSKLKTNTIDVKAINIMDSKGLTISIDDRGNVNLYKGHKSL